MRVVRDDAWRSFDKAADEGGWKRIKDVRDTSLMPGGRTRITLFERAPDEERPHPRFRTEMPPATDPALASGADPASFPVPATAPGSVDAFRTLLKEARDARADVLAATDLKPADAPKGSERYYGNSVRAQRIARFFAGAETAMEGWIRAGRLQDTDGARRALAEAAAEATIGKHTFDNANTGTYHSFQHDKPFVHYLESLLASLPEEGSEAFALLTAEQQSSVVRQRLHIQAHLDHLMCHKYAFSGITETDIEKTLGGLLIDRGTRMIVSETAATKATLVPGYELLRIAPQSGHASAGQYVYRGADDSLHLQDGTTVAVPDDQLRSIPLSADKLTFKRAPNDPRLRAGVRFDWDGNGYVSPRPVGWVSWAGHCDIKAIMEQLGLALEASPKLTEYRSDTGKTQTYDRDLQVEMIASVFELGSVYARLDGSGRVVRGLHRFGGARNDSLPDRLQFKGLSSGRGFRWPTSGRQDVFRVSKLEEDGQAVALDSAFFRYTPDVEKVEFKPNPRFLETTEGDYNILDVSGARLEAEVQIDDIDASSGYPVQNKQTLVIDLGPGAADARIFLGTSLQDAAKREIWKIYLNRKLNRIEADAVSYSREGDSWVGKTSAQPVFTVALQAPLTATLSREMKRDDPAMFQALLEIALELAQNINADTDDQAEVWNGTVTSIKVQKLGSNADTRTEHWEVVIEARFGTATLAYLLRRTANGQPEAYCPLVKEGRSVKAPDFLWQDFPDVGSKGVEGGDWVVNATMLQRGLVEVRPSGQGPSGTYVYDDHIKNLYELIFCALGGYSWTILHNNKRYGFTDEAAWKEAVAKLDTLRAALKFEGAATVA